MRHSLALFALVAVALISPSSALFECLRCKPNDRALKPIPHTSELSSEALMQMLSAGYQPESADHFRRHFGPEDELPGTVYSWLSCTQDKKKPKTILNKYSVQDLLDLNLIYDKKATLDEYDRRRQICEEFSDDKINDRKWRRESRHGRSAEAKLQNQKYFLSQYCWRTFRTFRYVALKNLDEQVKHKLAKKDNENINKFWQGFIDYFEVKQDHTLKPDEAVGEHVSSYDKEKLAKLKASCEQLDKLAETYRLKEFNTTKFGSMLGFCKKIKAA